MAFRHLAASWAECRARSSSLPSWGPARALGGLSLTSGNHLPRSCWVTDASCCAGSAAVRVLVESAWAWRWHLRAPCLWLCGCPGQSGPSGANLKPLRSCPRAPLEDHSPSPLCGHRPGLQPSYPFWSRPPLGTLDLPQGCPPAQGQLCCTPDSRLGAPKVCVLLARGGGARLRTQAPRCSHTSGKATAPESSARCSVIPQGLGLGRSLSPRLWHYKNCGSHCPHGPLRGLSAQGPWSSLESDSAWLRQPAASGSPGEPATLPATRIRTEWVTMCSWSQTVLERDRPGKLTRPSIRAHCKSPVIKAEWNIIQPSKERTC